MDPHSSYVSKTYCYLLYSFQCMCVFMDIKFTHIVVTILCAVFIYTTVTQFRTMLVP